ncbi:MAG: Gfo/Idh/MocA family oxidoreductase [Candidatus Omnitrophota bacterium]
MINIGIIGCGEWGPNHLRVFSQLHNSCVRMAADLNSVRLESMQKLYPNTIFTKDYKEILDNDAIDAVCIAVPTSAHYRIAREALSRGKHVLCEKPLALKIGHCEDLIKIAGKKKLILMVGYIYLFNESIRKIKDYIDQGKLGDIQYMHSERANLGPFRYDINALWDLAPHDVSIFNYLLGSMPIEVSACGAKYLFKDREDLAFITLRYKNNVTVNIHVSWLSPRKVRDITIIGDEKMLVFNDIDEKIPIMIYNKHVEKTKKYYSTFKEFLILAKWGRTIRPAIKISEPLLVQDLYFLESIRNKEQPEIANGEFALNVTKILIDIQKSMDKNGTPIKIIK